MSSSKEYSDRSLAIDASKIPNTADTSPATYFKTDEIKGEYWDSKTDWFRSKKEAYYKHLADLNQGKKVSAGRYNTQYETYMLNKDLIDALSSQLCLTQRQQSRAENLFLSLDLEKLGLQAESVAYVVCQYIVHSDNDDKRQCHPSCDIDDIPREFIRVRDSIKLHPSLMESLYGKLQHKFRNPSESKTEHHDEYGIRNP